MAGGGALGQIFGNRPQYQNVQDPNAKNSAFYQLSQIYPGLKSQIGQQSSDIGSELSGQIPLDIQQNIKDSSAAWGLESGMPGSGAQSNLNLADLGLTSLQEQQQGMSNYANFVPALQSMFTLNPEQTAGLDQAENAPDPRAAGLESILSKLGGSLLGAGTSLGGAALHAV